MYVLDPYPIGDEIMLLSACARGWEKDCEREYVIPAKHCGAFNVYCLTPVQSANDRYCMGR